MVSKFTRRHYLEIANAMREAKAALNPKSTQEMLAYAAVLHTLCEMFDSDNQNFCEEQFKEACK